MANVETLISQVSDPKVRADLAREVKELKKRLDWGLVFERHLPENTRLLNAPVKVGDAVWERQAGEPRRFRVRAIEGQELVVVVAPPSPAPEPDPDAPTVRIPADVLVERDFAESVFPALTSLGAIRAGSPERPSHAVIEGENFHALEMLLAAYAEQVDFLYLDPPYNTGARDWAYNNDYADPTDRWRHSKWLAFMERRLTLGRKLLKPDGVMVVTIDENEVHHLGMLLEQMFPEARIQMVSSLINPALQSRPGAFGRSDEYLLFVMFGAAAPKRMLLSRAWVSDAGRTFTGTARWDLLRRSGTSPARRDSPGGFYPIYVSPEGPKVHAIGEALPEGVSVPPPIEGTVAVLPIRRNGSEGRWQVSPATLRGYLDQGRVRIGGSQEHGYVIYYLKGGEYDKVLNGEYPISGYGPDGSLIIGANDDNGENAGVISVPSTQWRIPSHDATQYGSRLVQKFVPHSTFTFPKSLYAVRDALRFFTDDRPDALILDFFAGSGTTLHATMLLNAADGGRRRCVLVTNNEVRAADAAALNAAGHFRGDPEFEAAGVFEGACRPRISAAIAGRRADGTPVVGSYLDGGDYADGFAENVEFFRLDYLDPARVDLGLCFPELHPLLWLAAGGVGERGEVDQAARVALPAGAPYAVLFDPSGMPELLAALPGRPDVRTVFVVADSERGYARLVATLRPTGVKTVHLYRDYLEAVRGARS
jgi:adenine-specific DNA-methyltransferase